MTKKDELFETGDHERIWQKYCGFLDLSLEEFMEIQEQLLMEQIELVCDSPLAKKFMPNKPKDVSEFRKLVPLTTYEDYAPHFEEKNEDILSEKPCQWAHTSGRGGSFKWSPYTQRFYERMASCMITGLILALATKKGEVNLTGKERILHNLPPRPYLSGIAIAATAEQLNFRFIPPLELSEAMEFQERIEAGFKEALRTGVDIFGSLSSVLVKVGESFIDKSQGMKLSSSLLYPPTALRLAKAILRSKLEKRAMLPQDLWPIKAIMASGIDTNIYKDKITYYWGKAPYEYYACTEGGFVALQTWSKKAMVFIPYSDFLEFIPEEEWIESRKSTDYHPSTILLNEVKEGERYEIVITNFHGDPFLRYRLGDLIKIVALEDQESGVKLPQMVFESRADDLIDIASFTRLDEKTIWQAINNVGIKYEEWTIRKEYSEDKPVLHLYIELKEKRDVQEVERLIHDELKILDSDYHDLERILGFNSLKVTLLSEGTFKRYYQEKQAAGFDLAHLKPPHVNAFDNAIRDILRLGSE
jgi:hypothetical protein